jgi:uncharacterized membrane protein YidH (DUF202 family)
MTDRPGPDAEVAGAAERTHQSWRRTVLSALVVGLLAVSKLILTAPMRDGPVIVSLMALGWFAIVAIAHRRMATLRAGRRVLINRSPALLALVVIAYAALSLTLLR